MDSEEEKLVPNEHDVEVLLSTVPDKSAPRNDEWKIKLRNKLAVAFAFLRGMASGFLTTYGIAKLISSILSPFLASLAPGVFFVMPFAVAALIAVVPGIIVAISSFSLYIDGIKKGLKDRIPDYKQPRYINSLPDNHYKKTDKVRSDIVYAISMLAPVLEFGLVFYSVFTTSAALLSLITFLSPFAAAVTAACITVALTLAFGAFMSSFLATAKTIRNYFSKHTLKQDGDDYLKLLDAVNDKEKYIEKKLISTNANWQEIHNLKKELPGLNLELRSQEIILNEKRLELQFVKALRKNVPLEQLKAFTELYDYREMHRLPSDNGVNEQSTRPRTRSLPTPTKNSLQS